MAAPNEKIQETELTSSPNSNNNSNGNDEHHSLTDLGNSNHRSNVSSVSSTKAKDGETINYNSSEGSQKRSSRESVLIPIKTQSMDSRDVSIPPPSSSRRAYSAVAILFFINLLNYMDRFTIAGVLSNVQSDFGMNDAQSGLLQTMFICAYMIFAPIFGYLGDRYSRKWIMVVGIFIWSATVLLSTFVPSNLFVVFLLMRGVVGIGEASYSTVASTLIADLFTKDMRSRMLMIFYFAIPVGSGLGFMVGSSIAGMFTDKHVGWRWGVRVTPVFGLICLLLLIFVLKEPKRGESEHAARLQTSSWLSDLAYLLKNRSFVGVTLGFTCVAFASGCLSWWTPNFIRFAELMHMKEPDTASIGLIFGVITCLAGFVGVTVGSVWSQIWRRSNPKADPLVCGIGILLSVPFLYCALTFVKDSMAVGWATVFFAVLCLSLNWAIVSDILMYIVTPTRRSTASAFQILFSHLLGDAASPYLVGVISDAIRGGNESNAAHFYALRNAMYLPAFILVLGGFFFLCTAWFVEVDRKASECVAKGILPSHINGIVEVGSPNSDQHIGQYGVNYPVVVGEMPSVDSQAYLIPPDEAPTADDGSVVRYRL